MSTHRLIEHLIALRDDRAALAALRRGASPGAEASVYRIVVPFFPAKPSRRVERALVQTAILFGMHPGTGGVSVGAAMSRVRKESSESVEHRFIALLDCHPDDLPIHLRHAISLARTRDIPIDWSDVLDAFLHWHQPDRRIQRKWAREFWTTHGVTEVTQ